MGNFQKILVVVLTLALGLAFLKDQLIKAAVTTMGSSVIGAPLEIDRFSLSILSHQVSIKGMRLYNPEGFPRQELLDIPEISVDVDLSAILKGEMHIHSIVINVKQMTVIRNKQGKLNAESLKIVEEQKKASTKDVSKKEQKPAKVNFSIDYMRLSIGEVVVNDYQKSDPPAITAYTVGVHNKEFRNIKSAEQLVMLVMVEGVGPTGLRTAGLYAAATVLGVSFLPVGVATVMLSNDDAVADYDAKLETVFDQLVKIFEENKAKFKVKEKSQGIIKAVLQGCDVAVKIIPIRDKTKVTVSARKFLIPRPEVAEGVIHLLSQRIK